MHEDWSGQEEDEWREVSVVFDALAGHRSLVKAFEATKKGTTRSISLISSSRVTRLFRAKGALRQRLRSTYSHILIDEAQDLSRKQLAIVKAFAGEKANVMAVCDPYQTLFRFSGAMMGNMLNFRNGFQVAIASCSTRNFRSTQRILDAARASSSP